MIQITPQMKVHLYCPPIDFRKGIDGLSSIARDVLQADPFSGTVFLFRNRQATSVKVLVYDGQGFWLCLKRLSTGKFRHWPKDAAAASELSATEINVLLFNGDPSLAALLLLGEKWANSESLDMDFLSGAELYGHL